MYSEGNVLSNTKDLPLLNVNKRNTGMLVTFFLLFISVATFCQPTSVTVASTPSGKYYTKPQIPYPAHKRYIQGTLRPNHISQQEQDYLVGAAYDNWKKNYLLPVSDSEEASQMYRVAAGKRKQGRTYSEGQGFGMILTVYMAGYDSKAQDFFDGLWRYAKKHPSRIDKRLMAYQVPVRKNRRDSAFDGDCDMALALFLADSQWGSRGYINYQKEAITLTQALMENVVGSDSKLPLLGDWVQPNGKRYNQYSLRSSDIMPAHFKLFYKMTKNPKWLEVAERGQVLIEHMQTRYSPETGLLPDFIIRSTGMEPSYRPASSNFLESKYDEHYYYNAARVPWRLSFDALLYNDPVSIEQVSKIARWIVKESEGKPTNIGPGYSLNGKRLNNEKFVSKAFIAPFGVAVMVTVANQKFVNDVFDLCARLRQDYYEDTIGLLCLLLMTGNCWLPV
jgi:endo-1,4-beta-D-glucanase Y